MLKIIVVGDETYDAEQNLFGSVGDVELELEHSLVSLSKWESKHKKPFLSNQNRTPEELLDYIKAMVLTPVYPEDVFARLSQRNLQDIMEYIESTESATTFGEMPETKGRGETITAELIYYWMVAFNIPFACEQWHLNRLFALVRICNIKNAPPQKRSPSEIARRNRELNEQRKARHHTTG